jgi:FemAB-related protein (PEP-CTERM system-associated)
MSGEVYPQALMVTTLRIGLHPSLAPFAAEVKYAWRTLMHQAGFAASFEWLAPSGQTADLSYGPPGSGRAAVHVDCCGLSFTDAHAFEPRQLAAADGLPLLAWDDAHPGLHRNAAGGLQFTSDIVFTSFWLLTGAREARYRRDAHDNFHLDGSFVLQNDLLRRPLVSLYSDFLRRHFAGLGKSPLPLPWTRGSAQATVAFSHDVDYPEMIRAIEFLRVLAGRTHAPRGTAAAVLSGRSHFWKFAEWVEFARRYGTQPAFYFSARRGSLAQYAAGTPDCFYEIHSPRFRELFAQLCDAGCEIGLHASYNAHQDAQQLRREKESLEQAAGVKVTGGRHHYWRLNPQAPHETLAHHAAMGMQYDSSLAFEFYPGFRRGVCHPFRPFHPGQRRELDIVELPPAWMDDHFDRRLAMNRIVDPNAPEAEVTAATEAYAASLLDAVRRTGGVAIVDYHVRGMNAEIFPRYGPWLARFAAQHLDSSLSFATPQELARAYRAYEQQLLSVSRACTAEAPSAAGAPALVSPAGRENQVCTVDLLRGNEESAWDAFVESHHDATIYHSLAWKRVTEDAFGHRAWYLRAMDPEGRIRAVLPLFQVRGLFGNRLVSMPMRDRGGILATSPAIARQMLARALALRDELHCSYLELRGAGALDPQVLGEGWSCNREWIATRIDLRPGADALWKALPRGSVRAPIRKAMENGVRIEFNSSREGMQIFYRMFSRTRKSLGIPPFSQRLFLSIWENLVHVGKANLLLAWRGDRPIGGMINLIGKDSVIGAYAAPQPHMRKYNPSEFILWHCIEWAANNGFACYDCGADSHHQTGLLWFKKKWGGVQEPMHYYAWHRDGSARPAGLDSSAPSFQLARRTWALLPDAVSRKLGGWVTRQLS